jgi:hypothetical protein
MNINYLMGVWAQCAWMYLLSTSSTSCDIIKEISAEKISFTTLWKNSWFLYFFSTSKNTSVEWENDYDEELGEMGRVSDSFCVTITAKVTFTPTFTFSNLMFPCLQYAISATNKTLKNSVGSPSTALFSESVSTET